MTSKINIGLAAIALCATVCTSPAYAAGDASTRSAQVLPMMAASVGSVAYKPGLENQWRCAKITDKALKLKKQNVQVDVAGRVVLSKAGQPFNCRLSGNTQYQAQAAGFPFLIVGSIVTIAGVTFVVASNGNSDSPG